MPRKKISFSPPTPPHPATGDDFVDNMAERILRMQQELLGPALVFQRERVHNTLVFFGSAQIVGEKKAKARMKAFKEKYKNVKRRTAKYYEELDEVTNCLYMSRYCTAAEELAYKLAKWSNQWDDPRQQYLITSGGGPGIMEAANKGAYRAGGRTIGLSITIPTEQKSNRYITPELDLHFHYFLMRKLWLFYFAKALIIFPGGIGTLDEFFEVYTLMKTRKAKHYLPIVLYGSQYWKELINFDTMVRYGTIKKSDLDFLHYCDDVDEAFNFITTELTRLKGKT